MILARRNGWLWCAEGNGTPRGGESSTGRDPSTTPASGARQHADRDHPRNRWWDRSDTLLPPSVPIHHHGPSLLMCPDFYNSGGKYREVNPPILHWLRSAFVRSIAGAARGATGTGGRSSYVDGVHLHVSDLLDWAVPKQLPFNTLNHTSLQISQTSCSRRNVLL